MHAPPKRRFVGVFVLLLLGLGGAFFWRRHAEAGAKGPSGASPAGAGSASADARVVPVIIARAERKDVPVYLDGLGNAQPLATVTVRSQVDGRLDSVKFTEGQKVKKGAVLAQIDPRPFIIALHTAEATLAKDDAQSKNANRNLERYTNLVSQKLIPQQQVDDQQTTYDQAQASIASDRASIENARLSLDYARITSPIDGVTGVRLVDPGNIVHQTDTGGIVVVTQLDPMAVVFTLPEDDLPEVSREMGGPQQLVTEAYARDGDSKLGVGHLQLVDNQVNQATATIKLKAVFPNPDNALWPNAFLKVRLLLSTRKGALVVPAQAIQRGPQGAFVYVVDADKKANVRPVELDGAPNELAIITKGLSGGEDVVIEGQSSLKPGAKVAPRPGQNAPKAGANGPKGGASHANDTPSGVRGASTATAPGSGASQ
ncbi:MAG TPA: efflux RND transporter periplasmic adaptor subunit [Polyangiaceae bacterium]|nr:efflux RND transporter periplasmic adaptor subunit [Polyangiaceae bacterium]